MAIVLGGKGYNFFDELLFHDGKVIVMELDMLDEVQMDFVDYRCQLVIDDRIFPSYGG